MADESPLRRAFRHPLLRRLPLLLVAVIGIWLWKTSVGSERELIWQVPASVGAVERDRFNAETEREYINIRDFLVLHYRASERDDSEFWRYCRNLEAPDGLAEKLAMFRSSGRIIRSPRPKRFGWTSSTASPLRLVSQATSATGWSSSTRSASPPM